MSDGERRCLQAKYSGQSFQTRFFVLRGSILLYYVDHTHKEPKGVFLLDECKMTVGGRAVDRNGIAMQLLGNVDKATTFTLTLERPSGLTWELCAVSEEELQQWIHAFEASGVVSTVVSSTINSDSAQAAPGTPPSANRASHFTPGAASTATVTPVAPEHRPLPYSHNEPATPNQDAPAHKTVAANAAHETPSQTQLHDTAV